MLKKFFEHVMYNGLETLGRYYSSYRGHVMDNEDPDNMGRLKVMVPSVTSKATHPEWAYPRNSWSGQNYGMQLLPVKGDIVMVEFEHGDPKFPIWSHAHFSEGQKPEEFASAQVYGIKTPKGQLVLIDDRDGEEKIVIRSNAHIVIEGSAVVLESDELFMQGIVRGTPRFAIGANGIFTSTDGKVMQVTNGLISGITG